MLCHFEFRSLHVSLFNVSILKRVSQPTKECGLKTVTLTRRFLHFCYFMFQPRISGLFAQDIRPFQSSIWVATHQNWLQIHFSTTMHIWRLHDMAVTQRGKLPLADQTPVNLFVPVTQWQQDGGPKKKKRWRTLEMFMMHYSSQGEVCIMGMKRIFQKPKANVRCVNARNQYISQMSNSCPCTEADFEWWVLCSLDTLFISFDPYKTLYQSPEAVWRYSTGGAFHEFYFVIQSLLTRSVVS